MCSVPLSLNLDRRVDTLLTPWSPTSPEGPLPHSPLPHWSRQQLGVEAHLLLCGGTHTRHPVRCMSSPTSGRTLPWTTPMHYAVAGTSESMCFLESHICERKEEEEGMCSGRGCHVGLVEPQCTHRELWSRYLPDNLISGEPLCLLSTPWGGQVTGRGCLRKSIPSHQAGSGAREEVEGAAAEGLGSPPSLQLGSKPFLRGVRWWSPQPCIGCLLAILSLPVPQHSVPGHPSWPGHPPHTLALFHPKLAGPSWDHCPHPTVILTQH